MNSIYNNILKNKNFFLIAGPCVVESHEITFMVAEKVKALCEKFEIPFIFKASYKKANRSSISSFSGIGDIQALEIIKEIKESLKVPVITDIHSTEDAELASKYVDMLQIPAFLCRQTDLLLAAGKTGLPVNIKKGQFVSPEAMKFVADKVKTTGNSNILLTERGTTFGYGDLVVDYRSLPIMQKFGYPVVLDCTHSLQQPNQSTGVTGGLPELIETISKAGVAVGVDGLFIETHPDPSKALSDGANMLKLDLLEGLLEKLVKIKKVIN
ncbi:MAG: 3-deoxy-8-phosphooctulonate synthase [Bacteroidia bacterium]|nr:3-deoxy-8-phosphooctulonate synthase [Bacteroidia bacterium]